MTLPQKPPLKRRSRIATAIAVTAVLHVVALLLIARDINFKITPPQHRQQVSLITQRHGATRTPPSPHSIPTPGHKNPLDPDLPKDQLAQVKPHEQALIPGQVVDIGQPADERAPTQPTKYLSEKDSRVLKETRARETSAFFKNALSKAQKEGKNEKREAPAPPAPQEPPPGLPEPGKQGGAAKPAMAAQPAQLPSRERQDRVELARAADGTVRNRNSSEAVKGGGQRIAMARPENGAQQGPVPSPGAGDNPLSGAPGGKGKPLNLTLDNPLEVLGPVSGGPMPDELDGVNEGDETLLNSRSFRYAGYLNRVKETVGRIWVQKVQDEASRRDPSGQTYSYKDRRTVVEFTLDAHGEVKDVRVSSSSGVQYLDEVAADAFKKAERFPNPPPGLIGPTGRVTMPFAFTLLSATGGLRLQMGPAYVPGSPAARGW